MKIVCLLTLIAYEFWLYYMLIQGYFIIVICCTLATSIGVGLSLYYILNEKENK